MICRRKFIQKLGLFFTSAPLVLVGSNEAKGFKLCTLKVAGLQYGEMKSAIFVPKEKLLLQREPQNAYDKYAVGIYHDEKKVGYIPKENSRIIASLLDNGVELDVEVRYFDKQKPTWDRLWVGVWQIG